MQRRKSQRHLRAANSRWRAVRAWSLTEAESRALAAAIGNLCRDRTNLWRDDLLQAARIKLWRTSEKRDREKFGLAYRTARNAMLSERLRLVQHWHGTRNADGVPVEFEPWGDVHHSSTWDTPDGLLACRQAMSVLLTLSSEHLVVVSALLAPSTKRGVGSDLHRLESSSAMRSRLNRIKECLSTVL